MSTSLKTAVDKTLYIMGDADSDIWSRVEVRRYYREAYLILTRKSQLLWDMAYLETTAATATYSLPTDLQTVERVTHDGERIDPLRARETRDLDLRYRTVQGEVYAYLIDEDGINTLRLVRIPGATRSEYTVTGTWGILRKPTDISTETVTGTWGLPRRLPAQHPMKGRWGLPRRVHKETDNTRVEYYRNPALLVDDTDEFEIPNRYIKYLRWYTLWKCYERDGKGQDPDAAEHYRIRWHGGEMVTNRRRQEVSKARMGIIGFARGIRRNGPPRPRLPWQYGRKVK